MSAASDPAPHPAGDPPWYNAGLAFGCTGSGNCCKSGGGYGYIYVQDAEVAALAAHLGLAVEVFRARYCVEDDGWTVLRMDRPECPFLVGGRTCSVYPARPVQCRTWPFWRDNVASVEAWRRAGERCPGIGRGRRYSGQEVERIVAGDEAWQLPASETRVMPATDDGPERGAENQ